MYIASSGGFGGLFTALGLNAQAFLLNTAAFLVTAYIVGRWVFPPLTRALDAKKDELEAAVRHEKDASLALAGAKEKAEEVIIKARGTADEIMATAKSDATAQIEAARVRATEQGERLIAEAREQLSRDVLAARRELKGETAVLVAHATEAVLREKLDDREDAALIGRSLGDK
jgi:F-type H+-transporting ATPase subunit b